MDNTRGFRMAFASVYPHYITKAEKKGRTKEEVRTTSTGSRQPCLGELLRRGREQACSARDSDCRPVCQLSELSRLRTSGWNLVVGELPPSKRPASRHAAESVSAARRKHWRLSVATRAPNT